MSVSICELIEALEEKNKEIQKKNKEIQEKNNEIQEKSKEIQEKNNEIRDKNNEIRRKNNEIQGKDKEIQEKDMKIQEKDEKIRERDKKIQEKDKQIQEKDKEAQERDMKIQEKDNKIQTIINEIQDLKRRNIELENECYKYQSAATNSRLLDSDEKNPAKLKKDILSLQDSLEDYITTCKGGVEVNLDEIQKLLKKYGSKTNITKDQKPLIKAVLQHHVIQQIFDYSEEYFDYNNWSYYKKYGSGLETYLYNKAKELIYLSKTFGENRDGVDDTTKVLSVKLRQQIFTALGNRGFNEVINSEKEKFSNSIINYYQKCLNKEINRYRTLKDPERKLVIEEKAAGVIQKIINIFWFRLEVQEPVARYIWFKYNDEIDPSYMEGNWENDETDNIVVDVCSFPLIAQEFDNESNRQIYTFAKILHKQNSC